MIKMCLEVVSANICIVGVEPCAPLLVAVTATGSSSSHVKFLDGIEGEIRFLPSHLTRVFEAKNPDCFAQVRIEHGAVTWPGELNIAPHAVYDAVKKSGIWLHQ